MIPVEDTNAALTKRTGVAVTEVWLEDAEGMGLVLIEHAVWIIIHPYFIWYG